MLLAWLLLLSLVASYVLVIWAPLRAEVTATQDRLHDSHARLAKYQDLESQRGKLTQQIAELRRDGEVGLSNGLLQANSRTLALAELQNHIDDIIAQHKAIQTSSQPLNTNSENDRQKIEVSVNLTGSMEAIQGILFTLEQQPPRLFVDRVMLQVKRSPRRAQRRSNMAAAAAIQEIAIELSARLLIRAYMQPDATADATLAER